MPERARPDAAQALERLREGNRRFAEEAAHVHVVSRGLRERLANGQSPGAVVLGCSDSRVPPEIVFDQRPGEIFVIRIAGNVATSGALGSAEFAAQALGTPLLVVLGHSGCGAVEAAVRSLEEPDVVESAHLRAIVEAIRPSAEAARVSSPSADGAELLRAAVRHNVEENVRRIGDSEVLAELMDRGDLTVVGAFYDLETGRVTFHT